METNQKVAKVAESRFAHICANAGVVYNESSNDLKGWDFVVEPEAAHEPLLPEDRKIGHPKYFVQVKSSYTTQTAPIALSNAKIMANDPNPFFVIFFRYDSDLKNKQIYGIHIWEDEIFRILERLRKFSQNGEGTLNKKSIIFKFAEDQKIEGDLIEWMKSQVGNFASYHERKNLLVSTVGNEGFKISFTAETQKIVDLSLGKIDELHIEDGITFFDRRFGFESQFRKLGIAKLSINFIDNPSVTMRVSNGEGEYVDFVTQVFPSIIASQNQAGKKVRFKNELLSFVVAPDDLDSTVIDNLEIEAFNNAHDPETLLRIVRVLIWAKSGRVTCELFDDGVSSIQISLRPNYKELKLDQIQLSQSILTAMISIREAHKKVSLKLDELFQMAEDPMHQNVHLLEKSVRFSYDERLENNIILKFAIFAVGVISCGEMYLGIIKRDVEQWNFPFDNGYGVSFGEPKWLKTKHLTYAKIGLSKAEIRKINAKKDEFLKANFDQLTGNFEYQEFGLCRPCFEETKLLPVQEN